MNKKTIEFREKEWRHVLLQFVSGLLLFETLSGLMIYILPFSPVNQISVLLHTIVGLIFIIPFLWYLIRHWTIYRSVPMSHFKLTGYILMVILIILIVSGSVLTYQSVFGVRISRLWDRIHTVSTFAMIAFIAPHIFLIILRNFRTVHTAFTLNFIVW